MFVEIMQQMRKHASDDKKLQKVADVKRNAV